MYNVSGLQLKVQTIRDLNFHLIEGSRKGCLVGTSSLYVARGSMKPGRQNDCGRTAGEAELAIILV